jgi:hypothetical protein
MAEALQKRQKFALLFFEPAQGFGAVFVKSVVAARMRPAAAAPSLGSRLHAVHPPLHSLDAALPAVGIAVGPTRHSSTPDPKSQKHKAERPKQSRMMHDRRPEM